MTSFRISLIPLFKTKETQTKHPHTLPTRSPPSKYSNDKYLQTILLVKLRESQRTLEYNQMAQQPIHIFLIFNPVIKQKLL